MKGLAPLCNTIERERERERETWINVCPLQSFQNGSHVSTPITIIRCTKDSDNLLILLRKKQSIKQKKAPQKIA